MEVVNIDAVKEICENMLYHLKIVFIFPVLTIQRPIHQGRTAFGNFLQLQDIALNLFSRDLN